MAQSLSSIQIYHQGSSKKLVDFISSLCMTLSSETRVVSCHAARLSLFCPLNFGLLFLKMILLGMKRLKWEPISVLLTLIARTLADR